MQVGYHTLAPPPALAGWVRMYWAFDIRGIDGQEYVYRSLADGCAELVFHYQSQFTELADGKPIPPSHSHVHAQTQQFRRFAVQQDFGIFGAYLYPHALPALFGYSGETLIDRMPTLQEVAGAEGANLEEQMMLAPDNAARAALLSRFLIGRIGRYRVATPGIDWAIKRMIESDGAVPLGMLAGMSGHSLRQLERQFQTQVGMSPKRLARILRFQAATRTRGTDPRSLTEIALDCGYYDQAHFIHDFRQFSGYAPSEYFRGRPEGIEYREA